MVQFLFVTMTAVYFWGLCSAQSVKWRIITRITAHGRPAGSDATMRRVAPAAELKSPPGTLGGCNIKEKYVPDKYYSFRWLIGVFKGDQLMRRHLLST